jgi:hypothetical protein
MIWGAATVPGVIAACGFRHKPTYIDDKNVPTVAWCEHVFVRPSARPARRTDPPTSPTRAQTGDGDEYEQPGKRRRY